MPSVSTILRNIRHRKRCLRPKRSTPVDPALTAVLPHELWILIIRFATMSNPDPLDTSHTVSFLDPPHSMQLRLSAYHSSMRQKRIMCLVSRQWHAWAVEFMYEYVWVSRASHATLLACTLSSPRSQAYGKWVRRLHVETRTPLDKCDPAHLRTILDRTPALAIYSDHRSIRLTVVSVNTPLEDTCTPDDLFHRLPNNLQRLSWTSYEASPAPHMPSFSVLAKLAFLELNFHATAQSTWLPSILPRQPLSLPHLQTLKTSLCANTFSLLASWHLPKLRNISLVSSDFSYSSPSFTQFFDAHGANILQLELGHSSSSILEEHYLTPPRASGAAPPDLALLLPNLLEFICSANAEWNWENPDWIAPHILLPAHPKLKLIGIRDIDKRTIDGSYFVLLEQMRSLLRREAFPSLRYVRDMGQGLNSVHREKAGTDNQTVCFWQTVWQGCRGRGVYLEDWEGVNVTANDWRRMGFGV